MPRRIVSKEIVKECINFWRKDSDGKAYELLLKKANLHGLIAGATGAGKTVTIQILTEGFFKASVPGFVNFVPGTIMTIISTSAIVLSSWVWLKNRSEKPMADIRLAQVTCS